MDILNWFNLLSQSHDRTYLLFIYKDKFYAVRSIKSVKMEWQNDV